MGLNSPLFPSQCRFPSGFPSISPPTPRRHSHPLFPASTAASHLSFPAAHPEPHGEPDRVRRPVLQETADSTRGVGARNGGNDALESRNHHARRQPTAQQGVLRSVSSSPDLLSYASHLIVFPLIFPRGFVRPAAGTPYPDLGHGDLSALPASPSSGC